ncbi:MAG: DUF4296 domain-containing protein [Bacteroides sp.]|nr:DUF4296 domain-containing protein [Bacteroides sp.]MCM1378986.1 DUF4296 domain-containing protein [Bacteroides sp.]MCM1445602.1 DUF4296 domain-containing protein [Prevotella sp.]
MKQRLKKWIKNNPLALCAILLLTGALTACERVPDMVLKREPMARLLVDLQLANAASQQVSIGGFNPDSLRYQLRETTLARHGVNEAVLDSSMRWYGAHPGSFMKVIDRADSILADSVRRIEASENLALRNAAGDSVNVWPLAPSTLFSRTEPSNFYAFEVAVDSTWQRGDVLTLTFAVDNALSEMSTALIADYANREATTEGITARQYVGDQRRYELKLQLDSMMNAERVYGYFHLEPKEGERAFVDSIRLVRTRLISKEYNTLRRQAVRFDKGR